MANTVPSQNPVDWGNFLADNYSVLDVLKPRLECLIRSRSALFLADGAADSIRRMAASADAARDRLEEVDLVSVQIGDLLGRSSAERIS